MLNHCQHTPLTSLMSQRPWVWTGSVALIAQTLECWLGQKSPVQVNHLSASVFFVCVLQPRSPCCFLLLLPELYSSSLNHAGRGCESYASDGFLRCFQQRKYSDVGESDKLRGGGLFFFCFFFFNITKDSSRVFFFVRKDPDLDLDFSLPAKTAN